MSDPIFLLSVVTIGSGLIGLCIRYGFKSKCSEVALCCGLVTIHRDIDSEKEINLSEITHGIPEEKEEGRGCGASIGASGSKLACFCIKRAEATDATEESAIT